MPANQELLMFRIDTFLGPMGRGWKVLKEPAAGSDKLATVFLTCSLWVCAVDSRHLTSTPQGQVVWGRRAGSVGQPVVQATSSMAPLLVKHRPYHFASHCASFLVSHKSYCSEVQWTEVYIYDLWEANIIAVSVYSYHYDRVTVGANTVMAWYTHWE